jgi:hypothetical protein
MTRVICNDRERIQIPAILLSYAMLAQFVLTAPSRADFVERHLGTDALRELLAAILIGGLWWISVQRLCASAKLDALALVGAVIVIGCSWLMLVMHHFLMVDAHQTHRLMPVSWLRHLPRVAASLRQLIAYGVGALVILLWSSLSQATTAAASTPASLASHCLALRAARRQSGSRTENSVEKISSARAVWTKRSDDDVGWAESLGIASRMARSHSGHFG